MAKTYLALWSRVDSQGIVNIDSERRAALEAGFSPDRGATAWRERVRLLEGLGFLKTRSGAGGEFEHILLRNPHVVVREHEAKVSERDENDRLTVLYQALESRADQVRARDYVQALGDGRLEESSEEPLPGPKDFDDNIPI